MTAMLRPIVVAFVAINIFIGGVHSAQYLGKFLGKLTELHHGVSGEVYAVDGKTLHIKDFTYDGQGPAAYFFAGNSRSPGNAGFRIPDENGNPGVLRRYRKEPVTITLPDGKTLNSIKWFSVWCEEFEVNFGDVKISRNFDFPRPQKIDPLKGVHGISSDNIVIVDAQTLLIPNLSYDGEAPDAKFWVGRGSKPSPQGIRVPDENGKEIPLRRYDKKTVVLTLPGDLTVFDIGHFGIWCEAFTVDFGHVQVPQNLNIPPSLKMLGVSPQSKLNCEVLYDDLAFEVRWAVAGDSIVFQLVSKLDDREYMSFGISGDDSRSVMVGGDVVVAWVDKDTSKGYAEDYYLDAKSQCSGPKGSCPDTKLGGENGHNNIRLLNAAMVNGYSIITYQRPLKSADQFDRPILTNQSQAIIWAIGPLNERNEVSFHSQYTKDDRLLDFGRPAKWNCPMPESEPLSMTAIPTKQAYQEQSTSATSEVAQTSAPQRTRTSERRRGETRRGSPNRQEVVNDSEKSATRTRQQTDRRGSVKNPEKEVATSRPVPTPAPVKNRNAWEIPPIQCHEPEDGVFYAQMGPTGGKRGYPAITGHVGWGISWYINGLLIPEINVVRGKTYTFVVEGGFDPDIPAKYHPFYITDDPVGGYEYKTPEERKNVHIYAGVENGKDGSVSPVGVGRLCHWTHQGDSEADDFESFGAYQRTLELKCDKGEPGVIQWTPDENTPDVVYYQCFTHRYLGWKINVLDTCDTATAASEPKPSIIKPDSLEEEDDFETSSSDLAESPSIQVETVVKPNDIPSNERKPLEDTPSRFVEEKSAEIAHQINENIRKTQTNTFRVPQQVNRQTELPFFFNPQQSFFDQSYYLSGPQVFPASNYNPYPQFQYQNPYHQTFRPSQILEDDFFSVEPKSDIIQETVKEIPQTTTTTTSTTTTTTTTTTEATLPKTIDEVPILNLKPVNKTIFKLPTIKLHPQQNPFPVMYPRRPLNQQKFIVRQPTNQFKTIIRPVSHQSRPMQQPVSFKKSYYKPVAKMPPLALRPVEVPYMKHEPRPIFLSNLKAQMRPHPPNIIIMKPQHIEMKQSQALPPTLNLEADRTFTKIESLPKFDTAKLLQADMEKSPNILNVEVSRQQPSTEREPELSTVKPFTPPRPSKPTTEHYQMFKMKPAINTGFHPETVVVEGGFKPIISKEIQDRIDDDGPELEYESEIGVINIKKREDQPEDSPTAIETFEPMFVPSPLDKRQMNKINKLHKTRPFNKKTHVLLVMKRPRSIKTEEDEIAESAERVESYYLPPLNTKRKPEVEEFPPGVVITFDGRKVSGQSLTAKSSSSGSILDNRASKAAELLKASKPQLEKFKGDLPPLDKIYINPNAPQLHQHGSLIRGLGATSVHSGSQSSTKLTLVRQLEDSDTEVKLRRKREAHHTPEHTAAQEEEWKAKAQSSSSSVLASTSVVLATCLIKFF